jgi:hypothetical protein
MNLSQWNAELSALVANTHEPSQQVAARAFAKALKPYLEELPLGELGSINGGLRTLLSKIQAEAS